MPEYPRPTENYPEWATQGGAVVVTPNAGLRLSGWTEDQIADEGQFNWLQGKNGSWVRRLDQASLGPEIMGATSWYTPRFGVEVGASADLTVPLRAGVLWVDSRRLELDDVFLAESGQTSVTLAASSTTTMSVSADRILDYRVGGAAPAGFEDVQTITTDATVVTSVTPIIQEAPEGGSVIGASPRFTGGFVGIDKVDAFSAQLAFTVSGTRRWNIGHLSTEDLHVERFNAAGVSQAVELGFAEGGGVAIGGPSSEIANAPATANAATFGRMGDDGGVALLFDDVGTLAWTRNTGVAYAAIVVSSSDTMTLVGPGASCVLDGDGGAAFRPETDNTLQLGRSTSRWAECHAIEVQATRVRAPTSSALIIGDDDTTGDVVIQGDGSAPAAAPFLRIQNHLGQSGGDYDANSGKIGFRVGETSTNGTEDIVLVGASDLSPSRAYMIEARILGVENSDATDGYGRRQTLVYYNTDSTALAFGTTVEDTGASGGYGGWTAAAAAAMSIDGSNNVVLRVSSPNTTQRNWSVLVTMIDIDHDD